MAVSITATSNASGYTAGTPILFTITVNTSGTLSGASVSASSTPASIGTPAVLPTSTNIPSSSASGVYTFYATLVVPALPPPSAVFTFTLMQGATILGSTSVTLTRSSTIVITKTANTSVYAQGQTITYNYLIQNAFTAPVTITTVADTIAGVATTSIAGGGSTTATIPVAGSIVYTATYVATAADVTTGTINNTVLSVSTVGVASASLTLYAAANTFRSFGASITKAANVSSFSAVGTVITYTYTVVNTTFFPPGVSFVGCTLVDYNPGVTGITGPTFLNPGTSGVYTGTYVTTASDLAAGYVSNLGMFNSTTARLATIATPAYNGLVIPSSVVCVHSSSLVWRVDGEERMLVKISTLKDGDSVLAADGKAAKVLEVMTCHDQHPESKMPHTCVVFPPDSIAPGVPNSLFVIDPGHPIAAPEFFLRNGEEGLVPAGWYLDRGRYTGIYKSDWHAVSKILPGPSLRYDLILEMTSCGAYIANGVAVRARWTKDRPNYWHDADE